MAGRRSTSRAGTSVRTTTTPKPLARVHCTTARCGNCLTGALARADAQLRGQVEALNIGGAGAPDDELIYVGVVQELIGSVVVVVKSSSLVYRI